MRNKKSNLTGEQLVTDFQTVTMYLMTADAAKQAAKQSEDAVMQELSSVSSGNYLNPANINEAQGDYVARASVDAHIKKIQAEQLDDLSNAQLKAIIIKDTTDFVGRKVRIVASSAEYRPFDGFWFDNKKGSRSSELNKQTVEGKIIEIDFRKNLLVLKPNRFSSLLSSSLQNYMVYVVNPHTLLPAVEIYLM